LGSSGPITASDDTTTTLLYPTLVTGTATQNPKIGLTDKLAYNALTGNLGIGTTNPGSSKLYIVGDTYTTGLATAFELTLRANQVANDSVLYLSGTVTSSNSTNGMVGIGTITFSDTDIIANFSHNVNSYAQIVVQNKNSGTSASSDIIVNNDRTAGTTYYGDFGINGTTYNAGGPFGDADGTYLYSSGGSLSIGTNDAKDFRIATGSATATPVTRMTISGAGTTAVGIVTTQPKAYLNIAGGTATANTAPLKINSGTVLTTAEVGAIEYDGSFLYHTPNSTSGRAYIPPSYTFRLTASGSNIGATIADFFATPSSLSLEASSVYIITCFAYFTKNTAGTATWTHVFSSAPTVFTASLNYSPVTGIANGSQTFVLSYSGGQAQTSMVHAATASLTTAVNHFASFDCRVVTSAATNWRLRLTQSAGTATPLAGSFYKVEKVSTSTGTFVA
jgi:hypothetical protein